MLCSELGARICVQFAAVDEIVVVADRAVCTNGARLAACGALLKASGSEEFALPGACERHLHAQSIPKGRGKEHGCGL